MGFVALSRTLALAPSQLTRNLAVPPSQDYRYRLFTADQVLRSVWVGPWQLR